jgi:demethylmenaquinone methyltransferase/2-methoxy-6-polyprenyl-1,4-benzoquinol methylase
VLRPGGRALVLEFSMPGNPMLRGPYLLYLRHILPAIGGLISGDRRAYKYLNETVESFPSGSAFTAMMDEAGFGESRAIPLTGGIATLYLGDKQSPAANSTPR